MRTESFASLKLTFKDGTLSSSLEKYMPNVIFVRAELDGEPVKLARGPKPKSVEGLAPGDLVVEVERPLNTTRQRTECTGFLFEGEQEVLIHPGGTEGVVCTFMASSTAKVIEHPAEDLSDWEIGLTAEQFAIVGGCLNDHQQGSAGYWKCVEEGGVPLPED